MRDALARVFLIGVLAAAVSATAAAQSARRQGEIEQRVDRLAEQVRQTESIRAIKRLQAAYGHYAEFGLWNDFAELFADEGVGHYAQGPMVGREAIRKLFFEQVGQGRLGLATGRIYPHIVFQPVVTLDPGGRTARGRWHVLALLGGYGGNATWVGGVYENRYVFENGAWKIAELTYATQFTAPYERGWTQPPSRPANAPASGSCDSYIASDCTFALHFDPQRAGTPSPPPVVESPPADAVPADLPTRIADLERRAARLVDESAVTNLQHAYGYYVDRKLWDDVADLFAADATLELGNQGVYVGKPSIRRALEQFGPQGLRFGELNDHVQLQTLVTVAPDGASAQARGVDFAQWGTMRDGVYRAEWRESIFENRYVNERGVWKIAALRLYPRFITEYAQGWAKSAEPVPPPSKEFPPDRPPSAVYAVYPEFSIPPLHFANPATGAPPQYPDDARPAAAPAPAPARELAPSGASGGTGSLRSLEARIAAAERVAAVASAYDGAENVLNAHSYYLDERRWDDVANLFAVDGWKEVGQLGIYAGRERIRAALRALYPRDGRTAGVFAIHQTTQPVIDVAPDGSSAKIRERVLQVGGRIGADGEWLAGVYESEVVLENGVWKLAAMDLDYTWAAPYLRGWAAVAAGAELALDPGVGSDPGVGTPARTNDVRTVPPFVPPSALPPPDRPLRGPMRPPFPEILPLSFHYANPVSGRPPAR